MHAEVVEVGLVGVLVLLGGEADQALVVDVEAEWVAASDKGVDPQVELESLVEERVGDVGLHHALPVPLDFSQIATKVPPRSPDKNIPRPWQLASGLTIYIGVFFILRASWW